MRSTPSPFHFQIANPNDSLQGYSSGRNILENSVPHSNNYLSVQHDARFSKVTWNTSTTDIGAGTDTDFIGVCDYHSTVHPGTSVNSWKIYYVLWWKTPAIFAVIIFETQIVLRTLKRLHCCWSINICMDQPTDVLWSIRPESEMLQKRITQITTHTETTCFCHAHDHFHPFQQLSHMTLVLMAIRFMPKRKGLWSRCNVKFRWLSWNDNTYVHGVCVRHPPVFCHKLTVALKHNPLTFYDNTNSMFCRTPYRKRVFQFGGLTAHLTRSQGTICPVPVSRH